MVRRLLIKIAILALFIIAVIEADFYIKGPDLSIPEYNKADSEPFKESIIKKDPKRKLNGRININTATIEELVLLPGVGGKIAEKVIAHRKEKGFYRDVKELLAIKGIGEKRLKEIEGFIILDGETTLRYEFE